MSNYEHLIDKTLDGRYRIVRNIGTGGMSVVFEAVDLMNNRAVAVKMLKEEMCSDLQAVKRFINESKAVALLNHPGIVHIYDVVISDKYKYIVMEHIKGITLKSYIEKKGPLTLQEILSWSEQILRALAHAHSKGIIHRDIKPQNILLLKNGRIKVTDFGIAKLPGASNMTMSDKAIGTVYYISPEQASGKPIDRRSDLYSLGICMYEMATGTLPFLAESPVSVALMQVNDTPRPPREIVPDIPYGLEQIILGAMEKDPNRRFQDATQMLRHIAQLRTDADFVFHTKRVRRTEVEKHLIDPDEDPEQAKRPPSRRILDPKAAKKKPMKKTKKQSSSMFPIIMGVALAFLMVMIVCGYILLTAFFDLQARQQPITVSVPELIGQTYSAPLLAQYDEEHFTFSLNYTQSDTYDPGTIIEQEPSGGTSRKIQPGKTKISVTLTVAVAESTTLLPDYSISDYRVVSGAIRDLGLEVKEVKEYNANIDSGNVIRTDPAPGTPMKQGEVVTIYISQGAKLDMHSVPDFKTKTTLEAYPLMLTPDGIRFLVPGFVTYEYSETIPEGQIISQSLLPGSMAVRGTTIDFVISLGIKAPPLTVPAFLGVAFDQIAPLMTDEDGTAILVLGDFTMAYSEFIPAGSIMSQSIPQGTVIEKGTVIDFVISMGPAPAPAETEGETTAPVPTPDPNLPPMA